MSILSNRKYDDEPVFVMQAALEKAGKVIESESKIVLTLRESLRILELLENPPPLNEKLKKLIADYDKN